MSATTASELSVEFLRSVLSSMPMFVVRGSHDLRIQYINHALPGRTPSDVMGTDILSHVAIEYRDIVRGVLERVVATGEPGSYQTVASGPHGQPARYESIVTPVEQPDGHRGVCIIAMDVTERHRREQELRESEQKLRLALETTGAGLWTWDLVSGQVTWDERMHEICNRVEPCTLPEYIDELVHPDDREAVRKSDRRIMATREYVGQPHRILRSDGEIRWIMPTGRVITDDSGAIVRLVGACVDMTRERGLEEQVRHSRRMEAIGRLSAGVAHNVNNMLMVVLPTLAELRDRVSAEDAARLRDAEHAARSSADMIQQLMRFSARGVGLDPVAQPVGPLLERALRLCAHAFQGQEPVLVDIDPALPDVACVGGDIEQALVNLVLNARDAFDDDATGRRIELRARTVPASVLGQGAARVCGGAVRIDVRDNGRGLEPAELERVFEPFYTTKSRSGGTGLGLFTAYAIATRHGGRLDITSTPGLGTTVSLVLPAATDEPTTTTTAHPRTEEDVSYRMLVVDDEPAIRRVLQRNMTRLGHQVATAEGVEAATRLLEGGQAFDIVLLDRSMPDGPGDRLIPTVRRLLPEALIFFVTGRGVQPEAAELVDEIIFKPVSMENLHTVIARHMTGRERARSNGSLSSPTRQ